MYIMCCTLNEVGGHPDQFKTSVAAFHHANEQRVRRTPHAMLSTSTHDTKRGEDTRARPALLGAAEEWIQHVTAWSRILRARSSGSGDSAPPERNDEYEFYQLLFGAWPPELSTGGDARSSRLLHLGCPSRSNVLIFASHRVRPDHGLAAQIAAIV
jgi:(1->4)-alpha-D-glucan 1-alpha-D-glucosylmutase